MKWQVFQREITVSSRSIVEKNGRRFILIGDALRSPDYQVGHGVNDVFSMLWTLNSLMTDPAQELVSWQEKSATLSSDVDFMENIILSEKKKYAQMLSEKTDLMLMDNLKNEFIALVREKNKDELSIFLAGKRISPIEFLPYAFSIINDPEMQDFLLHQTIDNLDLSVIDTIPPFSLSGGLINRAISAGASAELIGFLLEKGVQPNVKYRLSTYDNFDNSSLRSACRAGKAELVQVLLAHKSTFHGLTQDYLIALRKALSSYCFYMEQDNRVEITRHIDTALSIMQAAQSEAATPIEEASTKYCAPARSPSPHLSFFRAAQSAPVPMSSTMDPQASISGSL
ncbi:hypothetical protein [Legionella sp. CNM-4043-24]|uniref:hypothetical protein n=1 Tax=Legionella sp. CNM-4043-24 TaxID=3421646 RepID=UPI00403AE2E6